jgi:hypothetical protein
MQLPHSLLRIAFLLKQQMRPAKHQLLPTMLHQPKLWYQLRHLLLILSKYQNVLTMVPAIKKHMKVC